jgi:hypothetical protein
MSYQRRYIEATARLCWHIPQTFSQQEVLEYDEHENRRNTKIEQGKNKYFGSGCTLISCISLNIYFSFDTINNLEI